MGKYALAKSQGKNAVKYLAACLGPLTCDASEFSIDENKTLSLRCVNTRQPPSYTEPFSIMLSRSVETLGYRCETRTASRGMIILSFRKTPGSEQERRAEILA